MNATKLHRSSLEFAERMVDESLEAMDVAVLEAEINDDPELDDELDLAADEAIERAKRAVAKLEWEERELGL